MNFKPVAAFFLLCLWQWTSSLPAASLNPTLLKAKEEAERKGYIFEASHDEIVAKAKLEGKLRVLSSLDRNSFRMMVEAFRKKYPFVHVSVEEISGAESAQRFLLELKTGTVKDWDVMNISEDFYNEYEGHKKRFDILGMAEHGVLKIPIPMIDQNRRDAIVQSSVFSVVAYNKNLIPAERVPDQWEDFLKGEFKGKKFVVEIRGGAKDLVAMAQLWEMEKVLDYARKLAAQDPIWSSGYTRALASIVAGEHGLAHMINWHTVVRAQRKDPNRALAYKVIEPVPVRLINTSAVVGTAAHPYAGLLWLEFLASPEGQGIIDKYEPLKSNLFVPGSEVAKVLKGRKVSVTSLKDIDKSPQWLGMAIAALGFPKAEPKR